MRWITFAATLLSSANIAFAAPVYLDCVPISNNPSSEVAREFSFSVKIDEASGNITHTDADGAAFNAKGFFTAGEVGYKQIEDTELSESETSYKIDRTNLSFVRTHTSKFSERGMARTQSQDDLKRAVVIKGTCKIADVKKRKF